MPRRTGWMLLGLSLVLAACTGSSETATSTARNGTPVPPAAAATTIPAAATTTMLAFAPATLDHTYACAFHLDRGNADGSVRLQIRVHADEDTGLTPGMHRPDEISLPTIVAAVAYSLNVASGFRR